MLNEFTQDEIVSVVSSIFTIKSINQNLDALQFEIQDNDFKSKFVHLVQKLEPKNLVVQLENFNGRIFLLVHRFNPPKRRRTMIPRLLFATTIVVVMIDGYFRTLNANSVVNIGPPLEIAALYTISLIGILGIHELGHILASKLHKIKTTWPYFIPGIPIVGIPTFGAFIMSRGFMTNRDTLFDIGISGPIAGLVVAIIVSISGAYFFPIIPVQDAHALFSWSDLIGIQPSIIMSATLHLAGKTTVGYFTPILTAAWFGFLITFLNLLPSWQLDGGHLARAALGKKWHKITTYAGIGVLVALDYWVMAIFVLSFSLTSPDSRPLDDTSPLSKKRKIFFVAAMFLAFLCAPLPFSILT